MVKCVTTSLGVFVSYNVSVVCVGVAAIRDEFDSMTWMRKAAFVVEQSD